MAYSYNIVSFFLPFFLSLDPFLPTHCRCRGYCYPWSHSTTHTNTLGRTPLDEGSTRRRNLYLPTHNTHKRQTSMPPVGFEPAILGIERTQTLGRAATGIGQLQYTEINLMKMSTFRNVFRKQAHTDMHTNIDMTQLAFFIFMQAAIREGS
jgi:hypothetical protein